MVSMTCEASWRLSKTARHPLKLPRDCDIRCETDGDGAVVIAFREGYEGRSYFFHLTPDVAMALASGLKDAYRSAVWELQRLAREDMDNGHGIGKDN